ncbi:MAG: Cysteine desulfurase [Verrucomicrobiales bacterium]|nr:Cysteine desulfurase [Verrucomicrobiales bacterium]
MIYFDHNATSPLHPAARDAWLAASEKLIGNPASQHRSGQRSENALEEARSTLARFLVCDPQEIIWTSGATEASNTVFHHLALSAGDTDELWISAIEHAAVLQSAEFHFPKSRRSIPVDENGVVSLNWIVDELKKQRPKLVAIMAANNETGIVQPWREVSELCRERGVSFFCDATQWLGKLPANGLGECDYVIGSAHKFGGPPGVGFLKLPANKKIRPLIIGGKQQESRRAGTENVPGVLAMMAALVIRETGLAKNQHAERQAWRDQFERSLNSALPAVRVLGSNQPRLWNTSMVILPDTKCAFRWVVKLDKQGFAVSTGSACASGTEQPSHVLDAMDLSPSEITNTVRFSAGWETSEGDWKRLLECIVSVALSSAFVRSCKRTFRK